MIGIIGAMKVELEALKARLQDVTVTRISGVDFYSGKLHGTDVVATVSGVGKVFAAVCAQTMVLKFGVNAIINTGVAGGLSPNLKRSCDCLSGLPARYGHVRRRRSQRFDFRDQ